MLGKRKSRKDVCSDLYEVRVFSLRTRVKDVSERLNSLREREFNLCGNLEDAWVFRNFLITVLVT